MCIGFWLSILRRSEKVFFRINRSNGNIGISGMRFDPSIEEGDSGSSGQAAGRPGLFFIWNQW
jgi:hypothetical protein